VTFLSADPIALDPLVATVMSPERGGVAVFLGVVRREHAGRGVTALEYSAYEAMAEQECRAVVAEAEDRWAVAVGLRHRIGRLAVGEVAVAVVAAGGHRDEAFAACRWVIDEIKRRVPIWKKEFYEDGSIAWVDPTAPSDIRPAAAPIKEPTG
jgi:molybdopterin synthase catalytic subunit